MYLRKRCECACSIPFAGGLLPPSGGVRGCRRGGHWISDITGGPHNPALSRVKTGPNGPPDIYMISSTVAFLGVDLGISNHQPSRLALATITFGVGLGVARCCSQVMQSLGVGSHNEQPSTTANSAGEAAPSQYFFVTDI